MSDETPQDSKTFDPTPQRKKQFRDEGKVASSKDVTSAVMFIASLLAFGFVGGDLFKGFAQSIRLTIEQVGTEGGRGGSLWDILAQQGSTIGPSALLFAVLVIGSVLLISAFQTGFLWAPKNIAFKPDRIAPLKKLGQILNPKQAGMQVLLSTLKMAKMTNRGRCIKND